VNSIVAAFRDGLVAFEHVARDSGLSGAKAILPLSTVPLRSLLAELLLPQKPVPSLEEDFALLSLVGDWVVLPTLVFLSCLTKCRDAVMRPFSAKTSTLIPVDGIEPTGKATQRQLDASWSKIAAAVVDVPMHVLRDAF
jgi:hypothetical protein